MVSPWRAGLGALPAIAAVVLGLSVGLGGYTFFVARGASYLRNDPAACANCHVMGEHLSAWEKSSHRAVATCNDCHVPHDLVGKYLTKLSQGARHSWAFTSGRFPDPLRITATDRRVVERNCVRCHSALTATMRSTDDRHHPATDSCVRCHASVGHWVR